MESDNTTGTESDTSEWDLANAALTSEYSEDSDEYGIYYGDDQMYDTSIGGSQESSQRFTGNQNSDRQTNLQMRKILNQMNMSAADSGYSGSSTLYPIHETGLTTTDSSGNDENSEGTISDSGSPVHTGYPVYGRYQKLPSQDDAKDNNIIDAEDGLDNLMLHRLPGENLGMILGIEGGKDGVGTVTSVAVKSVTLGGAAYRATGSSKGICVGDDIVMVNGLDLRTLSHDECIQVFKDMPLRVLLGIKRGQKDLPAFSVSPLPLQPKNEKSQKLEKSSKLKHDIPVQLTRRRDGSDSEEDGFGGFAMYNVTIDKEPDENLGISIVPSYGSTREYYQIKRILPSGAAAHSGELQVGDRLITCNRTSLRDLKQNHCLSIIKSASSSGNLNFEVIRPVYTGSSMEISVTLNNSSKLPSFDPSQYSLKSQSYDRNVDIVVTSESEDYLTVSEDEFSRNGRLADIPEVEANEVFASNSVRLAYQASLNSSEEESTETETEISTRNEEIVSTENVEIVDLNKFDTSPYHIANKRDTKNKIDLKQYKIVPKFDKSHRSSVESKSDLESDHNKLSPRSPVPRSDLDQISPRSPIPNTDIDNISLASSSYTKRQHIPRSDLDQISPRSPIPSTEIDNISVSSSSYTKRQQIPNDSEPSDLNLPYNYPSESVGQNIPVSDTEETRYNPLYEDSNLSEFTDSESQDVYINSPRLESTSVIPSSELDKISISSNRTLTQPEEDIVSEGSDTEGIAVPPPAEFSDIHNNFEDNPVTYIDDILRENSESVETSPIHENITFAQRSKSALNRFDKLSPGINVDDFENDHDAHLAFNSELTAPFDIVLQEQGICVQSGDDNIEEFEDPQDNEILQVVTSYDNGTVLISQFEPEHLRENTDSPVNCVTAFEHSDNTMDQNSEAMLKDALDMEYENLPDSAKFEARLKLGQNVENGTVEFDDSHDIIENPVAENIAKEIVKNEQGNYGYYMESDDEPDEFPEADAPEGVPDLPDMPPPMLNNTDKQLGNDVTVNVIANGNEICIDKKPVISDSNWTFRTKPLENDPEETRDNVDRDDTDVIKPVKVQRKVEIPVLYEHKESINQRLDDQGESDIIVPVKVERKVEIPISREVHEKGEEDVVIVAVRAKREFQLPETFKDRIPSPRHDDDYIEHLQAVVNKKVPPPVSPKPKKSVIHVNVDEDGNYQKQDEVQEEIITPKEVKKDNTKHLVNVINVVNALKAGAKDKDPDIVDRIEKTDAKDRVKSVFSSVIKVAVKDSTTVEMSPPKQEQISTSREEISFTRKPHVESSPPKQDIIEVTKEVIKKPAVTKEEPSDEVPEKQTEKPSVKLDTEVPMLKTNIKVENQKAEQTFNAENAEKSPKLIPSLNLDFTSGSNTDSLSPKSDQSGGASPSSKYKTTIGVPKPQLVVTKETEEPVNHTSVAENSNTTEIKSISKPKEQEKPSLAPTPQIKPLSQIRPLSFNPKSLSQTSSRPVQYKTTIGVKSGLSSLSKPLASSQKADHPIKRMESLPFEVSILKGILGIGIKTVMTPEGYVKVTEILPNGPVGREGNIKVGDYILSINSTQLTGLTDGKVQQILRLLPRGLSKIVASAVIPDKASDNSVPQVEKPVLATRQPLPSSSSEKSKLSPRQSSPLSSPRQPTITTNPNAGILLSRQPVPAQRSVLMQQTSEKSAPPPVAPKPSSRPSSSPVVSPRSPVVASRSPAPSTRQEEQYQTTIHQQHKPSPASSSSASPVVSPRQQGSLPQSPRAPPPVAPKPRKTPSETTDPPVDDPSKPIEAELFVSINATNENSPNIGSRNILPGSVNYDIVEGDSKTKWTAGVVSSSDLKNPEKRSDIKGNLNVVYDTETHENNVLNDTYSPKNDIVNDISSPKTDTECMNQKDTSEMKAASADVISEAVEKLTDIEKDLDSSQVDVSLLSNRSRTFSSSSNASSYTDFNECDVDGENIPEQIVEEEEADLFRKPESNKGDEGEEYESDFEEGENEEDSKMKTGDKEDLDNRVQSPDSGLDMDQLKTLAENIVTDVISSIKRSDFDITATKNEQTEEDTDVAPQLPSEAPPLPMSPPPTVDDIPTSESQIPPLPDGPPPLPDTEAPSEVAPQTAVVDLALYPDSDQSSEGTTENKPEQGDQEVSEVIDIVDVSVTTTLHAAAPNVSKTVENVNIDDDFECDKTINVNITDTVQNNIQNDTSLSQVIEDSKGQEGDKSDVLADNINVNVEDNDELSVSNVISMYSNLEKSLDEHNSEDQTNISETNNNVIDKDVNIVNKEQENFDAKSSTSRDNVVDEVDSEANIKDNKVENVQREEELETNVIEKVNGHTDQTFEETTKLTDSGRGEPTSPVFESLSPRSDVESPKSESKFTSRVDRILSETEDIGRGKCSPETDRMYRMFSSSDEPTPEGEGEIMEVIVNKGSTGLGFIIQGGKGTPKGDMPITVKRVFKGGPADGNLQVGDELCSVNGEDLSEMRQSEARTHLKFLPSGDLVMKIKRYNE